MTLPGPGGGILTGVGLVTAYGTGTAPCFEGLLAGAQPEQVHPTQAWRVPGKRLDVGSPDLAEVTATLPRQPMRALNAETLMLQAAARLALADAGIDLDDVARERLGVVVATQEAGLQDYAEQLWAGMCDGDAMVSPTRSPQTGFNAPAGQLSIRLGAGGPNVTLLNGAVGGLDALAYALDAVATDQADAMLVCGVDVVHPMVVSSLEADGAGWASRPFDGDRSGPAYGSAAAVAVIEPAGAPAARAARGRAVVGAVRTAYSPQDDLVDASRRALRGALQAARVDAGDVVACFAAANGSVDGDAAEARALHDVFGPGLPTCAVKGGVGECMGAGAVVQTAIAALSLGRGLLPATPGFRSLGALPPLAVAGGSVPLRPGPVVVHAWDGACMAGAAVLRRDGAIAAEVPR